MEELLRKRARITSKLERIASFCSNLNEGNITLADLHIRLEMLSEVWNNFDTIQTQIECVCSEDLLPGYQGDQEQFESKFCDTKAIIMTTIAAGEECKVNQLPSPSLTNMVTTTLPAPKPFIKLPPIQIPPFAGDYKNWTSFSDLFGSVVHNNNTLSNVQKLHYLKSSLTGEAARLLNSVTVTEANYAVAWQILKDRFSNRRQIIQSHLKALYSQPKLNQESSHDIRRMLDTTTENIRALHALQLPTESWDTLMTFLMTERLDNNTRKNWEMTIINDQDPPFETLRQFLENRCRALEAFTSEKRIISQTPTRTQVGTASRGGGLTAISYHSNVLACVQCRGSHQLFSCQEFLRLSIPERHNKVKVASLCFNCLKEGHQSRDCESSNCRRCGRHHNTLLHIDHSSSGNQGTEESDIISTHTIKPRTNQNVLLATAIIQVKSQSNKIMSARVLLDSGSQATFVSERLINKLQAPLIGTHMNISGLGTMGLGICRNKTELQLFSNCNSFSRNITAFVLPEVTLTMPHKHFDAQSILDLVTREKIKLADPSFFKPENIDLLLGADVYYEILLNNKLKDCKSGLMMLETNFGWIVAGAFNPPYQLNRSKIMTSHFITENLDQQLRKFWELEEIPPEKHYTEEEQLCEDYFNKTYSRTNTGRFMVKLPFNENIKSIGNTSSLAINRLHQLEKRLNSNLPLKQLYQEFMREYSSLGHMSLIHQPDAASPVYHIPHHGILRLQSSTTKLRAVFDGSSAPRTGKSLNETLMVGPTIQENLFNIVIRFRLHKIVFTTDIKKMYRQILVHPDHRQFQRIYWRDQPNKEIKEYDLNTVTYGTSCAPYLAIRCLFQLASDLQHKFPLAASAVLNDTYVDDIISGSDSIEKAVTTQIQLTEMLGSAGFQLHKWTSNSQEFLSHLSGHQDITQDTSAVNSILTKTLGLYWNPQSDEFSFKVELEVTGMVTKRYLLAQISKIFDPLGLLAPVVITAKLLMQRLWMLGVDWDETAPQSVQEHWMAYQKEIQDLSLIYIPRLIANFPLWELHGFSDASEVAYGAAVYLRSSGNLGCQVTLLCSKSRVAPLKTISLPRLELCAAVLLSKLMSVLIKITAISAGSITAWTDSSVVLAWLSKHPRNWKSFIANRVAEVQGIIPPHQWRHVPTDHNPADLLTRGMTSKTLSQSSLWWTGPAWLSEATSSWPSHKPSELCTTLESKGKPNLCDAVCLLINEPSNELLTRYSSWSRLVRITALCLRFIYNCRQNPSLKQTGSLSVTQLEKAKWVWVRAAQRSSFKGELSMLEQGRELQPGSTITQLAPFIDAEGICRVGGRLQEASIPYHQMHPIILPHDHNLTTLIIQFYHDKYLHAGPRLLLTILRHKYWILRAKPIIRKIIHRCLRCFRNRIQITTQLMGSLPKARVEPSRPFWHCGIDYAGPISLRSHKGRGWPIMLKSYISVFVCFSTKAIHLELVGDLTSQAFIAAFRRFTSRRGKPAHVYSDNGTNFIGANRQLRELYQMFKTTNYDHNMTKALAEDQIQWHFIPPSAPHFGGLWEAGVKAVKHHLRRTVGSALLTYEEMLTMLNQIEACLNSRPLCSLSNEIDDLQTITPGHFLIGQALTGIPDCFTVPSNLSIVKRWHLVQQITCQFWKTWYFEYCLELQQRPKWKMRQPNIEVGSLVILRESNVPPLLWPIARVIEVHPGPDSLVRTVTLKTAHSTLKRPVSKCSLIPAHDTESRLF